MFDNKLFKIAIYSATLVLLAMPVVVARYKQSEQSNRTVQNEDDEVEVRILSQVPKSIEMVSNGFLESTIPNRGKYLVNGWTDWGGGKAILYWVAPPGSIFLGGYTYIRGDLPPTARAFTIVVGNMGSKNVWCVFTKVGEIYRPIRGQVTVC